MELLAKNNPNILEMLSVPEKNVIYKNPIIEKLQPELFLSKLCEQTFAKFAFTQIKKAYGLEKKILNPVEAERKSVLYFCFVYEDKLATPLKDYLHVHELIQERIGLAAISHLRDCYNLYYSTQSNYQGITRNENSNDVTLSSIPKEEQAMAMLYFNKDAYSVYCKKYKEYWNWVGKRSEERYKNTLTHGKKYDAKNMMHVFRLLLMAKEIAIEGKINVFRKDRDFLLSIKAGEFEYEALVLQQAEALKNELPLLYEQSGLPELPDVQGINDLLVEMRDEYYK